MPIIFIGPTPISEKEAWGLASRGYSLSGVLPQGIGLINAEELDLVTEMFDQDITIPSYEEYVKYRDTLNRDDLIKLVPKELLDLYPNIDTEALRVYKIFRVGPDVDTQDRITLLGNYKVTSKSTKSLINMLYPKLKSDGDIGLAIAKADLESSRNKVVEYLIQYDLNMDSPQFSVITASNLGIDLKSFKTDTKTNVELNSTDADSSVLFYTVLEKYFKMDIQDQMLDTMVMSEDDFKDFITQLPDPLGDFDIDRYKSKTETNHDYGYTNRTDLLVKLSGN